MKKIIILSLSVLMILMCFISCKGDQADNIQIETNQEKMKEMGISDLEIEALRLINAERAKEGLEPIGFAVDIYQCAEIRAEEICVSFGHERPNGEGFRSVYEENGFHWEKYWTGENLAGLFNDMEQAISALMDSEPHRKNIMCPEYSAVAIGVRQVNGKYYMAQLFLG